MLLYWVKSAQESLLTYKTVESQRMWWQPQRWKKTARLTVKHSGKVCAEYRV